MVRVGAAFVSVKTGSPDRRVRLKNRRHNELNEYKNRSSAAVANPALNKTFNRVAVMAITKQQRRED